MNELLALAADPAAGFALATLVVMEIVLGIDNLVFIAIVSQKLPEHQRSKARRIGIGLSLILPIARVWRRSWSGGASPAREQRRRAVRGRRGYWCGLRWRAETGESTGQPLQKRLNLVRAIQTASKTAMGRPPMAAMSERLTITAHRPANRGSPATNSFMKPSMANSR
jgi:Integral membrane protein TerC family